MLTPDPNAVPKMHPATRPAEPDDPMNLHGFEVAGDPDVMLRMLVEEYARMGFDLDALMQLFREPFYQGFHGLYRLFGEDEIKSRVAAILSKCGAMRVAVREAAIQSTQLVELTIPPPTHGRSQDA